MLTNKNHLGLFCTEIMNSFFHYFFFKRNRSSPLLAPLIFLMVFISGCGSTLRLPQFNSPERDAYPYSKKENGVSVAIRPFLQVEEVEKYFGDNLLDQGIVPVYVFAENTTPSTSFLMLEENIKVEGREIHRSDSEIGDQSTSTAMAAAGSLGGIFPPLILFMPLAQQNSSDASMIKYNFAKKKLRAATLSPGRHNEGFVYFKITKEEKNFKQWAVIVEIENLRTRESQAFTFPIQKSEN